MACHKNGADWRSDRSSGELGKIFPRRETDAVAMASSSTAGLGRSRAHQCLGVPGRPDDDLMACSFSGAPTARLLTPTRQDGQR
eukprot:5385136-Pyramimonas_sp.AAC.1